MNIEDRQFLTEWGGACWHAPTWCDTSTWFDDNGGDWKCVKCARLISRKKDRPKDGEGCRTFDNWTDFGWLWEKSRDLHAVSNFMSWFRQKIGLDEDPWETFLYCEVDDCCQLICDFLRERGKTA